MTGEKKIENEVCYANDEAAEEKEGTPQQGGLQFQSQSASHWSLPPK